MTLFIADPVALAWVASSIIGLVVAIYGVLDGLGDLRALGLLRNGRRMIAIDQLRTQAGRVIVFTIWLTLGIASMFDERVTPLSPVTIGLVASNVILTLMALGNVRTRRALLRG